MTAQTFAEGLEALATDIDTLALLPGNPRVGDVDAVAASLARFGQRKPVVCTKDDRTVIAGNHTLKAARQLGWTEIAVAWVDDDDATAKAFALADNRTGELGTYDDDNLATMIAEVRDFDTALLADTGWDDESVDDLLAGIAASEAEELPPVDPDAVDDVPESAPAITVAGDVWLLGPHRVMCGDSTSPTDVDKLLDGRPINVAFTSPPYASQRTYDPESGFVPIHPDEYVDWFRPVAANVAANLADDGSWFVNIKEHTDDGVRHRYVLDLWADHFDNGWRYVDMLVWPRTGFPGDPVTMGRFKNAWEPITHLTLAKKHKFRPKSVMTESSAAFTYDGVRRMRVNTEAGFLDSDSATGQTVEGMAYPSNVLPNFGVANSGTDHSAAFPVALPAWFTKAFSDEGDLIYDPFMGSGTTLMAAHTLGRHACGMEISPAYTDIICRRYQEATGDQPINEATGRTHDFTKATP